MPEIQLLTRTRLTAEIFSVRFENPDNGFAVVTLRCADGTKLAATGNIPGPAAGQTIEAEGYYEKHPEYGLQFRVEQCRTVPPSTRDGVIRYLRHTVNGIGPKTAAAIVEKFGDETLKVLDLYPGRLLEVPKIGKKKAAQIVKIWKESARSREERIFLEGLGVTPAYCARLFKRYGDGAADAVRRNPYRLAEEVDGIGFLKADAIARNLGFAPDSPARMEAAAVYALNTMIGEGHVCAPEEELVRECVRLTGQNGAAAAAGLAGAVERKLLYRLDGCFYTPRTAVAETRLPEVIAALAAARDFPGPRLRRVAAPSELVLDPVQHQAVEALYSRPLNIITGGPGVGKTTVVGEIVRRAKAAKVRFLLAAPTGRAAKRLSESCGAEAKTIHRMLMFDPATARFHYDQNNRLNCELIIVDETSMLDIILACQLFQAIPPGCSVVLVGDADQLPSVGPGRVLADLMESGFFGVTKLTRIFRQSGNSAIIRNAHRVNAGLPPEPASAGPGKLADFYWIEQDDPERVASLIETLVVERIPERFHFDPMQDIQVLTPMNRGECGTAALNARLSARLRAGDLPEFQFGGTVFKQGDRIMQNANNYDKNIFNGDLGRIVRIDRDAKQFTALFDDDRAVVYHFEEADQINPAYAVTIHKSQGSEFPAVVMPLLNQHFVMLRRNLLYTGMTRAKKLLILIGGRKAVELAVRDARIRPRYSNLAARLCRLLRKNAQ
ncbi:MAG: ATP-dependent RecD-like DNA helicase [Lentisphaeria bacterium]|nr:ATP-dependent RecD-like DNA helicase [Lentisphaeria bacterium]